MIEDESAIQLCVDWCSLYDSIYTEIFICRKIYKIMQHHNIASSDLQSAIVSYVHRPYLIVVFNQIRCITQLKKIAIQSITRQTTVGRWSH